MYCTTNKALISILIQNVVKQQHLTSVSGYFNQLAKCMCITQNSNAVCAQANAVYPFLYFGLLMFVCPFRILISIPLEIGW
jgi:hypothetical protein